MRRRNRSLLLFKLFLGGPLTRQDLARSTGLSQAAVSVVTAELIEDGLVVEAGAVESDGGRPGIMLRIAPGFAHVAGVDVGETRVRVELFDLAMTPLATVEYPIDPGRPDPRTVVGHIVAGLDRVGTAANVAPADVLGVGIGVSGVVEQGPPAVVHAQTLGWDGVPFEDLVRAAGIDAPLHVDNGAKTLGQAEMWFGAGRGAQHAVFALIGSGVGAAVVTNGFTYRGASSSAGEWGHTTLVYDGRLCRCGARGCLEAYVGAGAIVDRYRQARRRDVPGPDEESQVNALIADADTSRVARRVLEETAGYLGAGVANLINLFNPERIVLGGWAGIVLGSRLLPAIREAAAAQALRLPYRQASIELCQLGVDAVALGAATLPIARLLSTGGVR
jgi:predicted NBD/HSP70 family sugar kinase